MSNPAEELAAAQADGKLKVDPSITVGDLEAVLENYLDIAGSRNFQTLLDYITAEAVSWTSRPKVCIF